MVCRLKNEAVIKKLLQENYLDLPKAIAIATATEITFRDAVQLVKGSTTAAPVHSIRKHRPLPKTSSSNSQDHSKLLSIWTHGTHSTATELQVQGNLLSAMSQTWSHHSSLPREEQQQAVMEQTSTTTGSAPAVRNTRLEEKEDANALKHFCLICKSEGLDGGANDQWYADPLGA